MATQKPTAGGYYPPVGFRFKVSFVAFEGADNDVRFQSVSGLNAEVQMESYKEAGNNMFEYQLPVRVKFSDITLKRGLLTGSRIFKWYVDGINNFKFSPQDINISLLNDKGNPVITWAVKGALPKKWSVSELNAEQSAIVVEQLDLVIREFKIITP